MEPKVPDDKLIIREFCDLYCGGGGSGSGIINAFEKLHQPCRGSFFNHWDRAIETHTLNHPEHEHAEADLFLIKPESYIPKDRQVGLLWASPSCVHFSLARGASPLEAQQRTHAETVLEWLEYLRPEVLLLENVRQFMDYGPLTQKRDKGELVWLEEKPGKKKKVMKVTVKVLPPAFRRRVCEPEEKWIQRMVDGGYEPHMVADLSRKGEFFERWVEAAKAQGYMIDWRLLKSADYGDPTIRTRFFAQAVRFNCGKRIVWPLPTHAKPDKDGNVPAGMHRWRTARDIIDWSIKGTSIFDFEARPRGLVKATMRRLAIGLVKFGLKEFLVPGNKGFDADRVRDPDEPAPTVTTNGRGEGIAQPDLKPFITSNFGERDGQAPRTQDIDDPVNTVTSHGVGGIVTPQPYILPSHKCFQEGGAVRSADAPVTTLTTKSRAEGIVQPEVYNIQPQGDGYLVSYAREGSVDGNRTYSADSPVRTLVTKDCQAVVQPQLSPFLAPKPGVDGNTIARSVDEPVPTVVTDARIYAVQPEVQQLPSFVVPKDQGHDHDYVRGLDVPMAGVQTTAIDNLVEPYVVQLKGRSHAQGIDTPVTALTGSQGHYVLDPAVVHLRGKPGRSKVASGVDTPMKTLTAGGTHEVLAEAFLMAIDQAGKGSERDRTYSPDEPTKTLTTKANQAVARISITKLEEFVVEACPPGVDPSRVLDLLHPLVEELRKVGRVDIKPWVYVYYGSGAVGSDIDAPVPTARTKENLGLCYPVLEIDGNFLLLDMFYRMFTVEELAKAQGFPSGYKFAGTKSDAVKAIGNSVSCGMAEALTLAVYTQNEDISGFVDREPALAS